MTTTRLSLDEEIRKIQSEISACTFRDDILVRPLLAARPADFIRALNQEQPDVVHFSGHGNPKGEIVFAAENGETNPVSPKDLAELFGTLVNRPKVIVLNACYSFNQVDSIASVVDVVIGFTNAVDDRDAISFAGQFYGALGEGVSVFDSFRQAIVGARLVNKDCWQEGLPQIMNKPGTNTSIALVRQNPGVQPVSTDPDRLVFSDRAAGRDFVKRGLSNFCEKREKIGVILIDIVGMNRINTRHGRRVGDRIIAESLVEFEDRSRAAVASGICGDDTFFCIYENDNKPDIMRLARQLMLDIESRDWGRISLGLYVRVEGGFALWRKGSETPTETIVRAAAGLKFAQRDRSTFSEGTKTMARPFLARLTSSKRELSEELLKDLFS